MYYLCTQPGFKPGMSDHKTEVLFYGQMAPPNCKSEEPHTSLDLVSISQNTALDSSSENCLGCLSQMNFQYQNLWRWLWESFNLESYFSRWIFSKLGPSHQTCLCFPQRGWPAFLISAQCPERALLRPSCSKATLFRWKLPPLLRPNYEFLPLYFFKMLFISCTLTYCTELWPSSWQSASKRQGELLSHIQHHAWHIAGSRFHRSVLKNSYSSRDWKNVSRLLKLTWIRDESQYILNLWSQGLMA